MVKSRTEKVCDMIERERDEEEKGRNVKYQCHQDGGPVSVSVATYHSIVCWLRARQCAARMVAVGN